MKNEEMIKDLFLGLYVSWLQSIGITTFSELKKTCIGKKKEFIRLSTDTLKPAELQNLNWVVARFFANQKVISSKRAELEVNLAIYYSTLIKARSIKALREHNIRTVWDIYKRCIDTDGAFTPLSGKKIGRRTNYDAARILHHLHLLSGEAFLKVSRPLWKLRELTEEEIDEDGALLLHTMEWSESTKKVIVLSVTLKFRDGRYDTNKKEWETITLCELIKTFMRINAWELPVFHTKGHIKSYWYMTSWNVERYENAFIEIREKLELFGYLLPEEEPIDS